MRFGPALRAAHTQLHSVQTMERGLAAAAARRWGSSTGSTLG
ncbi:hypothetical protein GL4_0677 [Methyloceanibacter caenitepidi]|uniref:Uncharacterized protein n=1 Tax=Methyloceanibacter caenitepidi TaxID=1384459 RepID=A0A0A8JZY1_9HYPH|nr:hypothetical protein GL4_0677 [Methyloceanibacter caenitepidi]